MRLISIGFREMRMLFEVWVFLHGVNVNTRTPGLNVNIFATLATVSLPAM